MMASHTSLLPGGHILHSNSRSVSSRRLPHTRWATLLLVLVCLISQVMAVTADADEPVETLVIDTRIPVQEDGRWLYLSQEEVDLRRVKKRAPARGDDDDDSGDDGDNEKKPTTTFTTGGVPTNTRTSTSSTVPASPLPSPLDGGLSANFTSSNGQRTCPAFINSFLGDPIFKQCYPLSLLLQGSRSFFNAQKSLVSTTQVLDASCKANATFCAEYLTNLAKNMTAPENCADDYNLGNSVVVKAHIAMVSYAPVYTASCLKDERTSMYCYANAVTNLTNPTNWYFYFLPLNQTLPGSSLPTCNQCLQRTMGVFHDATADRRQFIARTYESAAEQVNTLCGPSFVNDTLAEERTPNGSPRGMSGGNPSLLLLAALSLLPFVQWLI